MPPQRRHAAPNAARAAATTVIVALAAAAPAALVSHRSDPGDRARWTRVEVPFTGYLVGAGTPQVSMPAGLDVYVEEVADGRLRIRKGMVRATVREADTDRFFRALAGAWPKPADDLPADGRRDAARANLEKAGTRQVHMSVSADGDVRFRYTFGSEPPPPATFAGTPFNRPAAAATIRAVTIGLKGRPGIDLRDPAVDRLRESGRDHPDILLAELHAGRASLAPPARWALAWALADTATENLRDPVAKSLPQNPELAFVLYERAWSPSAMADLVAGLADTTRDPSAHWLLATAQIPDPEARAAVRQYIVRREAPMLLCLLDTDRYNPSRSELISEIWDALRDPTRGRGFPGDDSEARLILPALAAASYGRLDALAFFADRLKVAPGDGSEVWTAAELAGCPSPPDQLPAWLRANKARLQWSAPQRRFTLAPTSCP